MFESIETFTLVQWGVMLVCGCVASLIDLMKRRIPNWLTFSMVFSGLIALTVHGGLSLSGGLADSLLGLIVVSLPLLFVYALGGGGGGDVKFMMGVGAWSGVDLGLYLLGGVMVCGFIYAILMATFRGEFKLLWYGVFAEILRLITRKKTASAHTATLPPLESSAASEGEGSFDSDAGSSTMVWAFGPVMLFGLVIGGISSWYI
jgi:Flp pilus assembly protein protease CpaA